MLANGEVEEFAYEGDASPAAADSPPQVVRSRVIRLLRSPSSVSNDADWPVGCGSGVTGPSNQLTSRTWTQRS